MAAQAEQREGAVERDDGGLRPVRDIIDGVTDSVTAGSGHPGPAEHQPSQEPVGGVLQG